MVETRRDSDASVYSSYESPSPSPPDSPTVVKDHSSDKPPAKQAEFYLDDSSSSTNSPSVPSSIPGSVTSVPDVRRADADEPPLVVPVGDSTELPPPRPLRLPRRPSVKDGGESGTTTATTTATTAPPLSKSAALAQTLSRVVPASSPASGSGSGSGSSPSIISNPFSPSSSPLSSTQNLQFMQNIRTPLASPLMLVSTHSNSFTRASQIMERDARGRFGPPPQRLVRRKPAPVPSASMGDVAGLVDATGLDGVGHETETEVLISRTSNSGPSLVCLSPTPFFGNEKEENEKNQIMKSTMLVPGTVIEKPWLVRSPQSSSRFFCFGSRTPSSTKYTLRFKKDKYTRLSYILSLSGILLGVIAAVAFVYVSYKNVPVLKDSELCLSWEEDWSGGGSDGLDGVLKEGVWQREVSMGGFGNGEFEMTSTSSQNSFISDNTLYIIPTLTSQTLNISPNSIFDGYTYNLTGCTSTNSTNCGAVSNATQGTMLPPVMSARLNTKLGGSGGGKGWMKYGRLEVKAKLPKGDWIWPAIWMLPVNDTYGPWPMSGEIDLMEARGNDITYPYQGRNFVRSTLNYGPNNLLNGFMHAFGWWKKPHGSYADDFHTYAMEWTEEFMRFYVDSRLTKMLQLKLKEPFFERGQFPPTVFNVSDSQDIAVINPWEGRGNSAPFDQPFYLILNVAVGGTNGWFPDRLGNKPWFDSSLDALHNFAKAQDQWYSTWPEDPTERGMAINSIKVYSLCNAPN